MGKEEKDGNLWKKALFLILWVIWFILWSLTPQYPYSILSFLLLIVVSAIYGLMLLHEKIERRGRRKRGETIMIRCWNCRTELPEGVDFCHNCGKPLERTIKEHLAAFIERAKP